MKLFKIVFEDGTEHVIEASSPDLAVMEACEEWVFRHTPDVPNFTVTRMSDANGT